MGTCVLAISVLFPLAGRHFLSPGPADGHLNLEYYSAKSWDSSSSALVYV